MSYFRTIFREKTFSPRAHVSYQERAKSAEYSKNNIVGIKAPREDFETNIIELFFVMLNFHCACHHH